MQVFEECSRSLLVQFLHLQLGKLRIGREVKVTAAQRTRGHWKPVPQLQSQAQTHHCWRSRGAAGELATTRAAPSDPSPQPAHGPATCSPAHRGGAATPGPHGNTLPGGPHPPHRRAVHLAPSPPQLGGLRLSLLGTRLLSGGLHCSPTGDQSPGQQHQVPAPPGTTKMTNCWVQEEMNQKPPDSTFRAEGRNTSPDQSSVTEDRKEQFSAASGGSFLETVDLGSRPPRSVNLVYYPVKQWWS